MAQYNTLADGQLGTASTSVLSSSSLRNAEQVVGGTFVNVGTHQEKVVLQVSRAGGTARQIHQSVLQVGDSLSMTGLPLQSGDTLNAYTSNASSVDYLITDSKGPLAFVHLDACGRATTGLATEVFNSVTTVTVDNAPSVFGQTITYTAAITAASGGAGTGSGTVTFLDGGSSIATAVVQSGQATYSPSTPTVSVHTLTAIYSGDTNFIGSTSTATNQTVNKASTTGTVTSDGSPVAATATVTLSCVVAATSPGSGTPTGTVTFKDGSSSIGTGGLTAGKTTMTKSNFTAASHTITAIYAGDANFSTSTSGSFVQVCT